MAQPFTMTTITAAAAAMLAALALAQPADQPQQPTTAPTTQQATYERLLGSDADRADRPILPTARPTVDQSTGSAAVAPNAPQLQTRREGSYIVNQVGRLTRASEGQGWEFTFNADGTSLQDPPMKVLPNLKLMVMEEQTETLSRDVQFRVTGMVTEYRGRNYILLEKVVVVQPEVK